MRTRFAVALFAAAAGLSAGFAAAPAFAASHYECQIHGFRAYNHRHIDPNDTVVSCDRPQQAQLYPTSARCVAHALRNGGAGGVISGSQMTAQVPYPPDAPAFARADAINIACSEAIESCFHVVGDIPDAQCEVMDRSFVD